MENISIECTGGNWKILPKLDLLVGADEINIANFNNGNIPAEERLGNLILCGASKTMHQAIELVAKQLRHYIENTKREMVLSNHDKTSLFVSRLQFILVQLQYRLPKQLKSKYQIDTSLSESLMMQFKVSYQSLSNEEKANFKQEVIEYLSKEG